MLTLNEVIAIEHVTQPPPRFDEASFVRELEARGVGRPSTYARIIKTLKERGYVEPAANFDCLGALQGPMLPSLSAFVLCDLLEKHCPIVIDPEFTASMEAKLDMIASGQMLSEDILRYVDDFYAGQNGLVARVKRFEQEVNGDDARRDILSTLDELKKATVSPPCEPLARRVEENDSKNVSSASLHSCMIVDKPLWFPVEESVDQHVNNNCLDEIGSESPDDAARNAAQDIPLTKRALTAMRRADYRRLHMVPLPNCPTGKPVYTNRSRRNRLSKMRYVEVPLSNNLGTGIEWLSLSSPVAGVQLFQPDASETLARKKKMIFNALCEMMEEDGFNDYGHAVFGKSLFSSDAADNLIDTIDNFTALEEDPERLKKRINTLVRVFSARRMS